MQGASWKVITRSASNLDSRYTKEKQLYVFLVSILYNRLHLSCYRQQILFLL